MTVQPATRVFFRTLLCLALVLPVGRAAAAQDVTTICEPFEVRIHLRVDRSITSAVVLADLEDETAIVWRPYGVHLEWTDVRADESATQGLSLEAILERRIGEEPNDPIWIPILGRAYVNLDAPARRPVRVSFEATEKLLGLRKASGASVTGLAHDRELARALGRVLAHEIGHVLLAAPNHDERGLMRVNFGPDELAAPDRAPFRLTCLGVGRLRSRIRMLTGVEREPIDQEACLPGRTVR
jgi:hypothetical protein